MFAGRKSGGLSGDAPTGNPHSRNMLRVLAHDEGRAVVCVTHDPAIAEPAGIRIEMRDGRVERIVDNRGAGTGLKTA